MADSSSAVECIDLTESAPEEAHRSGPSKGRSGGTSRPLTSNAPSTIADFRRYVYDHWPKLSDAQKSKVHGFVCGKGRTISGSNWHLERLSDKDVISLYNYVRRHVSLEAQPGSSQIATASSALESGHPRCLTDAMRRTFIDFITANLTETQTFATFLESAKISSLLFGGHSTSKARGQGRIALACLPDQSLLELNDCVRAIKLRQAQKVRSGTSSSTPALSTPATGTGPQPRRGASLPTPDAAALRSAIMKADAVQMRSVLLELCTLSPALSRATMRCLTPNSPFAQSTLQSSAMRQSAVKEESGSNVRQSALSGFRTPIALEEPFIKSESSGNASARTSQTPSAGASRLDDSSKPVAFASSRPPLVPADSSANRQSPLMSSTSLPPKQPMKRKAFKTNPICGRCGEQFDEDANENECVYHPGTYNF